MVENLIFFLNDKDDFLIPLQIISGMGFYNDQLGFDLELKQLDNKT